MNISKASRYLFYTRNTTVLKAYKHIVCCKCITTTHCKWHAIALHVNGMCACGWEHSTSVVGVAYTFPHVPHTFLLIRRTQNIHTQRTHQTFKLAFLLTGAHDMNLYLYNIYSSARVKRAAKSYAYTYKLYEHTPRLFVYLITYK